MNKLIMIMKGLLLILIIREANSIPLRCDIRADAKLSTNLTVKVRQSEQRNEVWIDLAAEFFDFGNIDCANILINDLKPTICSIEEGNVCSQDRCMIHLSPDNSQRSYDNYTFTDMNFNKNTNDIRPGVTYVHSVALEVSNPHVCEIRSLPTIYEGNITGNIFIHYIYLYNIYRIKS